jgi:hypothetical protein
MKPSQSDQQLDKDLDQIKAEYQGLDSPEPPDLVDQAVLNRARRAVEERPAPRNLSNWYRNNWIPAVATTAVIVLALSIVIQQQPVAPPSMPAGPVPVESQPAPARKATTTGARQEVEEFRLQSLSAEDKRNRASEEQSIRDATGESAALQKQFAEPQQGQQPAEPMSMTVGGMSLAKEKSDVLMDDDGTTDADAAVASELDEVSVQFEGLAMEPEYEDLRRNEFSKPEAWLQRIRELRDAGATEEAIQEQLSAFVEAYPDYPIPADLQP